MTHNQKALETSLKTLTRVLNEVDWQTISRDKPEAWSTSTKTSSRCTTTSCASAQARITRLRRRLRLWCALLTRLCADPWSSGLASPDVTVADPAVGTGTFLLGVFRRIAATVEADQGAGAVRGRHRGGGETGDRIRASVRPLRRGAAPHHRRDAGADGGASRAAALEPRPALVHHKHARKSFCRGGDAVRGRPCPARPARATDGREGALYRGGSARP